MGFVVSLSNRRQNLCALNVTDDAYEKDGERKSVALFLFINKKLVCSIFFVTLKTQVN